MKLPHIHALALLTTKWRRETFCDTWDMQVLKTRFHSLGCEKLLPNTSTQRCSDWGERTPQDRKADTIEKKALLTPVLHGPPNYFLKIWNVIFCKSSIKSDTWEKLWCGSLWIPEDRQNQERDPKGLVNHYNIPNYQVIQAELSIENYFPS
jgi:hypothetical protein